MQGAANKEPGKSSRLRVWLVRFLVVSSICILVGAITILSVLIYFNSSLPPLDTLEGYDPPQVTRLFDRKGRVVGEFFEEKRTVVAFASIPKHVRDAFLAAEDADFYHHKGLDFPGLLRAFWANLKAGKVVQGGSTITQQVIKTFLLGPERSYSRKIKELLLAFKLESNLTKDEILFLYLNQIYFGHGCYGIQEASRFYFGKNVQELNLAEGAVLAGLPKSPARYSPVRHPELSLKRRNWILGQMLDKGMIGADDLRHAVGEDLGTSEKRFDFYSEAPYYAEYCRRQLVKLFGNEMILRGGLNVELALDLDLQKMARKAMQDGLRKVDHRQGYRGAVGKISLELLEKMHENNSAKYNGGRVWTLSKVESASTPAAESWNVRFVDLTDSVRLLVPIVSITGSGADAVANVDLGTTMTTLDLQDVSWARRFSPVRWTPSPKSVSEVLSVGDVVEVLVSRDGKGGLKSQLSQPPLVQGAVVSIDPHNRHVLVMIGGSDYRKSPFIRAVQSRRQPGSSFKPIVYAAAIDKELITPVSILMDSPEVYPMASGKAWKPMNYERQFLGPVTVRYALAHSINTVAVKIASEIGVAEVIKMARTVGIESELMPNLTLALGSSEVTPLEITNAYSTFASGGIFNKPVFITKISTPSGEQLPIVESEPRQGIRPEVAYVVTSLLRSVIEMGTGRKAKIIERPLAGKTGTANQQRDGWFVGYSPDLACGVWVGFDDHSRMGRGWATGAGTALPIWIEFMKNALENRPRLEFSVPPSVVFARIDPDNGLLAPPCLSGAEFEPFIEGTEPRTISDRCDSGENFDAGMTEKQTGSGPVQIPDEMFR